MMNSSKAVVLLLLPVHLLTLFGCSNANPAPDPITHEEPEAIARTEFTERVENFFEYEQLHAGKPSQVRIHLTDLSDGSPVEQAVVSTVIRRAGRGDTVVQTTAKVGKVTGIYVAEWNIPRAGEYDIEFHIKNARLDEHLSLSGFKVE